MKKTTIRIVGFLFAAACVALLASCNKPTDTAKKTDDKKTPTTSAAPAFDKAQLKGAWKVTEYMALNAASIGNKAYLFSFDDKGDLRLAYGDSLTPTNQIKTKAAKVEYEIKEGKIKVLALGLRNPMPVTVTKDTITITLPSNQKIVLTKLKDSDVSGVNFTADNEAGKVVENFNTNLFQIPVPTFAHPKKMTFKIVKLNNKEPGQKQDASGPKVYHVAFADTDNKFILTVDQKAGTSRSAEKNYSTGVVHHDFCEVGLQITAMDLGFDKARLMVKDVGSNKILTIFTAGDQTELTTEGAVAFDTLNGYTANDGIITTAIQKFDKKEE